MKRFVRLTLAFLLPAVLAAPAQASEVIFRGREIDLLKSFVCNNKTMKSGRHNLEVSWDEASHRSKLTIFRGEKDVCEVAGAELTGNQMPASKIRILTRVNAQKKTIEIEMITPSGLRDQIPNQVFLLPLAEKD